MLELTLQRLWHTPISCCGELTAVELPSRRLFTLELPVKDGLPGSAIPPGRYNIVLAPSPKFMSSMDPWVQRYAKQMPHLIGIPRRSLIMIHWGNYAGDIPTTAAIEHANTEGCILVGRGRDTDMVSDSRAAFEELFTVIEGAARADECWINVQGGRPSVLAETDPPQLGADESTQI